MNETKGHTSRRGFFVGILQGLLGLLFAVPALGYLLRIPKRRKPEGWILLASRDALPGPGPHRVTYSYEVDEGYRRRKVTRAAYVFLGADEPLVLSPVCTHMGCNVAWNAPAGEFRCPCHGGRYDAEGHVLGGPPPRPLDRFPVRWTGDDLEIRLDGGEAAT